MRDQELAKFTGNTKWTKFTTPNKYAKKGLKEKEGV